MVGRVEFEEHGRVVPRRKGLLSLFFYIHMVDKVVKGRLLPPSFMPRFNPRLPKRRIPPGRIPPFDLPCPTVAPRLDHGNGSCL